MKTLKSVSLTLLCCIAIFTSCRTEDDLSIDPPAEQRLIANSSIADLMRKTSQRDGSFDNIIDNASCISVQLPVSVIANGTAVTVNSRNDYQLIEDIFDASDSDVDTLDIVFPITVIFADHTTLTVNTYPQLLALAAQCPDENSLDDDIECIDFQYPITASVFNQNNDLVATIVINNDNDLYDFIDDLDDFAAVTISFPITLILADGTLLNVNNINELAQAIENAEDTCDEDDDNDYNDDDCDNCTSSGLTNILSGCTDWIVDELEVNDNDLEDQYRGFIFNFGSNGSITVTANGSTIMGTWTASGTGNNVVFTINIPSLPDFNGSWNLREIEQESGETEVEFEKANDDELSFKSNC